MRSKKLFCLTISILFDFQIFNRDEPDREKLVHVTVKASDNGRPQLEDVCTLAVKINDQNDNSPVFDRANYGVPIAQVRSSYSSCILAPIRGVTLGLLFF
jgi:hypothetical protein